MKKESIYPRNEKPHKGDIVEITGCYSGRPSKYLYVGARIKVCKCWQVCDVPYRSYADKDNKMIRFTYRSPKGNILGVSEKNYSWKIVEKSSYTEESLPKFIDIPNLTVDKDEFEDLLLKMSNAVEKINRMLSNYPYPEKKKQ